MLAMFLIQDADTMAIAVNSGCVLKIEKKNKFYSI